jgi:Guanine nucleotide exchange factor synembryn
MANLLESYNSLSTSSPRPDVSNALNAIMSSAIYNHPTLSLPHPNLHAAFPIDDPSREGLITALLSDIETCKPGSTGDRLHHTGITYSHVFAPYFDRIVVDILLALSAVKALGRQSSGSSVIASASNLSTLLVVSKSFKESNLEASLEALRCIANALLLIESARATLLSDAVGGGEYAVLLLEVGRSGQSLVPRPPIHSPPEINVTRCHLHRVTNPLSCHCIFCNCRFLHHIYRRAKTVRTRTHSRRYNQPPS